MISKEINTKKALKKTKLTPMQWGNDADDYNSHYTFITLWTCIPQRYITLKSYFQSCFIYVTLFGRLFQSCRTL